MQRSFPERRRRRSARAEEALALQLQEVRDRAKLDAIVLASEEGLAIAHSGEPEFCTELAALAPFIPEASPERTLLRVRSSRFAGREFYLVSYSREGRGELESSLDRAWRGVSRILSCTL